MGQYKLTATALKSGKTKYQVLDEGGKVVSSRTSARHYVACTIDGSFYFGQLDLIGKGDHGKKLAWIQDLKHNTTPERYRQIVDKRIKEINSASALEHRIWVNNTSKERREAPIEKGQLEFLRERYGEDERTATAKTQQDYLQIVLDPKYDIAEFLKWLGTFEEWKAHREKRLAELEPAMEVAYLNN